MYLRSLSSQSSIPHQQFSSSARPAQVSACHVRPPPPSQHLLLTPPFISCSLPSLPYTPVLTTHKHSRRRHPVFCTASGSGSERQEESSQNQGEPSFSGYQLKLYTKPDCPLCDGIKEKVTALITRAQFLPSSLAGASLEVCDVSSNAKWADEYASVVPVLTVDLGGGPGEVQLPRIQPRTPADRVQRMLEEALSAASADVDA